MREVAPTPLVHSYSTPDSRAGHSYLSRHSALSWLNSGLLLEEHNLTALCSIRIKLRIENLAMRT